MKQRPTKEYLDSLFTLVDNNLYWKIRIARKCKIGNLAGSIKKHASGKETFMVTVNKIAYPKDLIVAIMTDDMKAILCKCGCGETIGFGVAAKKFVDNKHSKKYYNTLQAETFKEAFKKEHRLCRNNCGTRVLKATLKFCCKKCGVEYHNNKQRITISKVKTKQDVHHCMLCTQPQLENNLFCSKAHEDKYNTLKNLGEPIPIRIDEKTLVLTNKYDDIPRIIGKYHNLEYYTREYLKRVCVGKQSTIEELSEELIQESYEN